MAAPAVRPSTGIFSDLASGSILGKRQSEDIADQATLFKRAKMLQTGACPVCDSSVDKQSISSSSHGCEKFPSFPFAVDVESDISESQLREEASVGAPVSCRLYPEEFALIYLRNIGRVFFTG